MGPGSRCPAIFPWVPWEEGLEGQGQRSLVLCLVSLECLSFPSVFLSLSEIQGKEKESRAKTGTKTPSSMNAGFFPELNSKIKSVNLKNCAYFVSIF
jgi:hypothetical protein